MSLKAVELPYYLAEWYRPQLSAEELDDAATKLEAGVAATRSDGSDVRLLMTLAMPTDEVLMGVFAAESAQIVCEACRRAGLPAERLTNTLRAGSSNTEI